MVLETILLPRDDAGVRNHVERYKAFRLQALKTAPLMFGSTYERESAFTSGMWETRLKNPRAFTLLTLQDKGVVGSLTMISLPFGPEELPAFGDPWKSLNGEAPKEPAYSHWRLNAMFTLPEVRGQGIAKALIKKGIILGHEEAAKAGKEFVGSVVVDLDNPAAKSLYEKCGFCDNSLDNDLLLTPLQIACNLAGTSIPSAAILNAQNIASSLDSQVTTTVTTGGSSATGSTEATATVQPSGSDRPAAQSVFVSTTTTTAT
ncbi:hypothetical protein G7Y89_g654 [Cudoniella acicularis]|uniref:N-acetyltransferase domain-containing protein n=1 Tax=Cudoniella acicularis TaxID=354080 RepID=A0A8H4RXN4_9HELO|nr:hypothetical protein G7Y89_g654 [Cudoniella acicularis]